VHQNFTDFERILSQLIKKSVTHFTSLLCNKTENHVGYCTCYVWQKKNKIWYRTPFSAKWKTEVDISVSLVTRLQAEWYMFKSQQKQDIFLFSTMSRLALGPNQLPIWWLRRVLSPVVQHLRHKADNSPASSAKLTNVWATPPLFYAFVKCTQTVLYC